MDCQIVILACNTASAKALRTIQQNDLQILAPAKRVLGVIRPTVEKIGELTHSNVIGLFGTDGTIQSKSYELEIAKIFPQITVITESCALWVPLIENNFHNTDGADFFVKHHINNILRKNIQIDAIILGCTHYPLLSEKIRKYLPEKIKIITQGSIVAESFADYLNRHPEHETLCSKNGAIDFFTTESPDKFKNFASIFFNKNIEAKKITV
jgi:glutamate racemase